MSFDDLKIPLLVSSILLFLIAVYMHLLRRWKRRSKTLKYPHLFSLENRRVNGDIQIKFELHMDDTVAISILNDKEIELKQLLSETKEKGLYTISFDTSNLTKGIYYYQLITTNQKSIKRFEKI